MTDQILAVIPARAGSKGLPGKNIRPLAGKPLIAWTIEVARACEVVSRTLVTTDGPEIADIARQWGAEVPFLRPAELAQDDTPDLPVCRHVLDWLREKEGYQPDLVVWLRPTAPLRLPEDVVGAVDAARQSGADCVRSVCLALHHPYWMKTMDGQWLRPFIEGKDEIDYPRRQLLPPAYRLNGAVDVTRPETVAAGAIFGGRMAGYVMPIERSEDIDSELDFEIVEAALRRRNR